MYKCHVLNVCNLKLIEFVLEITRYFNFQTFFLLQMLYEIIDWQ